MIKWYHRNGRTFPWRDTQDPYHLFVAEVLLQKTRASNVTEIYSVLIDRYPKMSDLAQARKSDVSDIVERLGLVNSRTKTLIEGASEYLSEYNTVPDSKDALVAVDGLGEYSSNAILCFAFDRPVALVDGNIARVLSRVFAIDHNSAHRRIPKAIKEMADQLLPRSQLREYNFGLLDFGFEVCSARKPKCTECALYDVCLLKPTLK